MRERDDWISAALKALEQDGLAIDEDSRKLVIHNREHATAWFEEALAAFDDKSDEAAGGDDDQPGKRAHVRRVAEHLAGRVNHDQAALEADARRELRRASCRVPRVEFGERPLDGERGARPRSGD